MPKVSIIVPVYNTEKYLHKCLDSIVAQTFTDFEAVLVDDGSTDGSGKICDEYAAKDHRFVVIHKRNEGVAKARIAAFEHSKGELITFIDSDDYVSPEYLEKLSNPILEEDADIVSCNFYDVDSSSNDVTAGKITLEGFFIGKQLRDFITNNYFYESSCHGFGMTNFLCTKMLKKRFVLDGLKNGVGLWFGEDQIALFSMLYKSNRLCIITDRLYYYVHYKEQATKRYDLSLWTSLLRMFEKYDCIDTNHIATTGLRLRTWLYINTTIFNKMAKANLTKEDFCNHLLQVRESPYIEVFFKPLYINFNLKENIKYWLLKLKLFNVFYLIVKRNAKNNET